MLSGIPISYYELQGCHNSQYLALVSETHWKPSQSFLAAHQVERPSTSNLKRKGPI